MKEEDLKEFEQRLLGLVREWLAKESDGSKVGHFGVIYDVVDYDETKPAKVAPPGFPPGEGGIAFSFSSQSDWINEALLREALEAVQGQRMYARDDDEDESEDEDD